MALSAGRVGVKKDQVDWQGNLIGGGSSDLEPRVEAVENQISTFSFRDNEGTPQYKTSEEGEWINFSAGVEPFIVHSNYNALANIILHITSGSTPKFRFYETSSSSTYREVELQELGNGFFILPIYAKKASNYNIYFKAFIDGVNKRANGIANGRCLYTSDSSTFMSYMYVAENNAVVYVET